MGEGLLLPGKLIGRRAAHTPPLPPVLSQPATPPPFPYRNQPQPCLPYLQRTFIFLQDSRNNLKFLVDSGGSISILLHSSSAPPTGPHLVGANGKQIPAWGLRRRTVCFSGHNFEFDFLLAAVATPILVMSFLARFELSIIPAKQQLLHEAAPSPWQVPLLLLAPGVLRPLEEFPSLLRPSAAPYKPLQGVVHHIDTGSAAPVFACPRRLDPEKHHIPDEEFLALEKAGIIFEHLHGTAYPGRRRATRRLISSRYVWKGLSTDVTAWAATYRYLLDTSWYPPAEFYLPVHHH